MQKNLLLLALALLFNNNLQANPVDTSLAGSEEEGLYISEEGDSQPSFQAACDVFRHMHTVIRAACNQTSLTYYRRKFGCRELSRHLQTVVSITTQSAEQSVSERAFVIGVADFMRSSRAIGLPIDIEEVTDLLELRPQMPENARLHRMLLDAVENSISESDEYEEYIEQREE